MSAAHFHVLPKPRIPNITFEKPNEQKPIIKETKTIQPTKAVHHHKTDDYVKFTKNDLYFVIFQGIILLLILFLIFYSILLNQKINQLLVYYHAR